MCLNAIKKSNVYHPRKEFHFMKIDETMIFKFSAYVKYIFEFFNYISNTYMIHKGGIHKLREQSEGRGES